MLAKGNLPFHRYERTKIDLPMTNIFNFYFNSYFNGLKINIVPYVKGATVIVHTDLLYYLTLGQELQILQNNIIIELNFQTLLKHDL
jgi:hypothetical protein